MTLTPKKYFGLIASEVELEDYHVSLTLHNKKNEIPLHSHNSPYMSLNLGCDYLEFTDNSNHVVKNGDVILRPANYRHKNIFSKNNGVCFNIELLNFIDRKKKSLFDKVNMKQSNLNLQELFVSFINGYKQDELAFLIHDIFSNDVKYFNYHKTPNWYNQIIEYINEEYTKTITLQDLSKITGNHPNYISRKFKKINGLNIGKYIRNVRTQKAFEMLTSEKKLTEIGLETGFYDQPHFTKTFANIYGINPLKFRSKLNKLISYN